MKIYKAAFNPPPLVIFVNLVNLFAKEVVLYCLILCILSVMGIACNLYSFSVIILIAIDVLNSDRYYED